MRTVELFYMPNCPYCVKAKQAVAELKGENESYFKVPVKWINEEEETDYVSEHDYYYVPTAYVGNRKIFEAQPGNSYETIKIGIKEAFDKALK